MKLVIILGALFTLVVNSYGVPFQGRILGGELADIEDFPYQAALLKNGAYSCGGSIISKNWILTAANCVDGEDLNKLSVVVGTAQWATGGTRLNVSRIIVHPQYNVEIFEDYDFAVVQVSEPIPIGSSTVQAIPLASSEAPDGAMAVVSGWGQHYQRARILKKALIPIVSRENCSHLLSQNSITERMVCAGWPQGNNNTCYRDNGGPLVVDGEQVGIVSWYYGLCAQPNSPSVFANVPDQIDWIREQTGV